MCRSGCAILPTSAVNQLIVHGIYIGVTDRFVVDLYKPCCSQTGYVRHRNCGGCRCNSPVKGNRRKILLPRLAVVPELNWTTLCQLVGDTHVLRFRDTADVDVDLVGCAIALANNGV